MCGRTRCTLRVDDYPRVCNVSGRRIRQVDLNRYRPSYNVSPGFNVPVVRREDGPDEEGVVLHCMKWGLIPSFTKPNEKPDHYKMFNARSETIKERASFRRLLPKNRCLVAVEGFYEWKKNGSKRQPYYIHFKDGRPLVFAALYDSWENGEGEILHTFTIVTTSSSSSLGWLHDRMPVIFGNKESSDSWLNGSLSFDIDALLKPYEKVDLVWYPVTPAMGKSSFDGPECIVEIQLKAEEAKSIARFFSKKGDEGTQEQPPQKLVTHEEPPKEPQMMAKKGDDAGEGDVSATTIMCGKESVVIKAKRGYEEEFMDDDKTRKMVRSPHKKRATSSTGKQPTIFSFFRNS